MSILFCGVDQGMCTASTGHHFAGRGTGYGEGELGPLLSVAVQVAQEIDVGEVEMRFIKPLVEEPLLVD
ncbi:hypothetical protein G3O06_15480 [Burkholderia sp. Ac-20345]|uniref:hypothetical protein n=1 Tax=Burkholderia sp. Ac-20345 TaxID=2703891 RepID=UPI00197C7893|nr:hypothetical protein [Burkholderia sp. Ac-20345]